MTRQSNIQNFSSLKHVGKKSGNPGQMDRQTDISILNKDFRSFIHLYDTCEEGRMLKRWYFLNKHK